MKTLEDFYDGIKKEPKAIRQHRASYIPSDADESMREQAKQQVEDEFERRRENRKTALGTSVDNSYLAKSNSDITQIRDTSARISARMSMSMAQLQDRAK